MAIVPVFAGSSSAATSSPRTDVLTLGDLVEGVSGPEASRPLFRAPALGETRHHPGRNGSLDAAAVPRPDAASRPTGRAQVTRHARRPPDRPGGDRGRREAAARGAARHRSATALDRVRGSSRPPRRARPEGARRPWRKSSTTAAAAASRPSWRSARSPGERRASARVTGALVELVEVAVLNRPFNRGETVQASDVTIERRVRETRASGRRDRATRSSPASVARRALAAGTVVRAGDLAKPEIVAPRRHRHRRLRGSRPRADAPRPRRPGGRARGHHRRHQPAIEDDAPGPGRRSRPGVGRRRHPGPLGRLPPPAPDRIANSTSSTMTHRLLRVSALALLAGSLAACTAADRLADVGRAPNALRDRGSDRPARLQARAHADARHASDLLRLQLACGARARAPSSRTSARRGSATS